MANVVTDNKHYTAIAGAIRAVTGDSTRFTPAEMPDALTLACQTQFQQGVLDGFAQGAQHASDQCAQRHFTAEIIGTGSASLSFHVPFEPDALSIMGYSPDIMRISGGLAQFLFDRRAFGFIGGHILCGSGSNSVVNLALTTASALSRYSRSADGTVTIQNIGAASAVPGQFARGVLYVITAVKYTDQTDRERITDFVHRLTGSGTANMNQAKVAAAFSDEEWAQLIAEKPDWTFVFV